MLRVVAVLLVVGVIILVDGDATLLVPVRPGAPGVAVGIRLGLGQWPPGAGALWVNAGHLAAGVSQECAALTAVGLAVACGLARCLSHAGETGLAARPAVLGGAAAATFLPPRWVVFARPDAGWTDAHLRWAVVLCVATAAVVYTLLDPARGPACRSSSSSGASSVRLISTASCRAARACPWCPAARSASPVLRSTVTWPAR